MVAAALTSLSFVANTPRYVALTSLVALVAGAMLIAARILRAGFLADFLSRTVLVGFLTGVFPGAILSWSCRFRFLVSLSFWHRARPPREPTRFAGSPLTSASSD